MRRRIGRLILLATTGLALAGCATMNVSSHVREGVEFTQYRTYDWGPADALPTGDARLDRDPFFLDHMEGAVERGLAIRGIARVSEGTPDLLVHYHASIAHRIDINRIDQERGYCYDDDCRVRTVEAEAGTLVIDVIDARTNRLVWRGWARHSVADMLRDRDRMEERINEAVTRMLDQLPNGLGLQGANVAQTGAR